jgi:hypothetical protein
VALFGQVIGCHVAQSWATTWHPGICCCFVCKNILEFVGFDPWTSPPHSTFTKSVRPTDHRLCLYMYTSSYIFEFKLCDSWQGVGPGLSPGPRSFCFVYDHAIYDITKKLAHAGF